MASSACWSSPWSTITPPLGPVSVGKADTTLTTRRLTVVPWKLTGNVCPRWVSVALAKLSVTAAGITAAGTA